MTANDLTKLLLLELPQRFPGARAWRRNTGGGYPVAVVQHALALLRAGQVAAAIAFLASARMVSFGLSGEPDVDGFLPLVGPTGEPIGVRLGLEVKADRDRQRADQKTCERVYSAGGCIYVLAHDVERTMAQIEEFRRQLSMRIRSTNS
jgi:hypothetical protein